LLHIVTIALSRVISLSLTRTYRQFLYNVMGKLAKYAIMLFSD